MKNTNWKSIWMMLTLIMLQAILWAQDGGGTTTTKVEIEAPGAGNWFSDYWMWIVGGIVFIILLIALMGGGGRSSRSTRTVVREDPLTGTRTRTTTTTDDDIV